MEVLVRAAAEEGRKDDEGPQHEVEITKSIYLGKYEVTQQQHEKITGENPSSFSRSGSGKDEGAGMDTWEFPVEHLSWDKAVLCCELLEQQSARENTCSACGRR